MVETIIFTCITGFLISLLAGALVLNFIDWFLDHRKETGNEEHTGSFR
jgi:hypothetical protein